MRVLLRDLRTYFTLRKRPLNIIHTTQGYYFDPAWNPGVHQYERAVSRLRKYRLFRWYEALHRGITKWKDARSSKQS